MYKIARFFSVLSLGLSVGVGAFAQPAVGVGALAQPAGTEDADMTKEKLFPVGGGVGLTHFRVVMPGVLYRGGTEGPRAGVDGPRRPLQNQSLQALCKAGFSQAVYAYRTGWNGTENVSCAGNSLQYEYHQWDNRAALKQVFVKLHEIITQDKGAMYVHCWYGLHASGFISATALAQFCGTAGWDSRRAAEYWDSVIPPKIRYPKEHDQVANFVRFTDPELQISVQDATRVCPRHN
jgi:hypothetical protein